MDTFLFRLKGNFRNWPNLVSPFTYRRLQPSWWFNCRRDNRREIVSSMDNNLSDILKNKSGMYTEQREETADERIAGNFKIDRQFEHICKSKQLSIEIPIVRHIMSTSKPNCWDVSIQTESIVPSIRSNLSSKVFCASVDKVSNMRGTIKNNNKNEEHLYVEPIRKCLTDNLHVYENLSELKILPKAPSSQTKHKCTLIRTKSCDPYLKNFERSENKSEKKPEVVKSNSNDLKIDNSENDTLNSTESSDKPFDIKETKLPMSPSSLSEESDPDWCFDLTGTTDDNSTSDDSTSADKLVRGNRLIRFVSTAKRRIIQPLDNNVQLLQAQISEVDNPLSSPTFTIKPNNISVKTGETAVFSCACTGLPEPTVEWFLHGVKLQSDNRTFIKKSGNVHYLSIEDLCVDESGTVKCSISNYLGKSELYVQLIVKDLFLDLSNKTLRILKPLKNVQVTVGQNAQFTCKIYGENLDIRWYQNGKVVKPDKNKSTDYKNGCAYLKIQNVELNDSGVITCFVCNETGKDRTSCILRVTK